MNLFKTLLARFNHRSQPLLPTIGQIQRARDSMGRLPVQDRAISRETIVAPLLESGVLEFPRDDRFISGFTSGYHLGVRASRIASKET
jgi:hypothetical protein